MNKTILKVEGMSCNHCKMAVEKAAKEVKGVEDAQVNLEEKELAVTGTATPEQLIEAITKAGYEVKR
ncbi:CopZ family metallochaperone [Desulfoscipio sp. XC116]|uniref:CopZ family metallochaperone n=1 Tax=Desulfoscipio sp. XC116 TaxID=3144975 RepID=UPI00325A5DCB